MTSSIQTHGLSVSRRARAQYLYIRMQLRYTLHVTVSYGAKICNLPAVLWLTHSGAPKMSQEACGEYVQ